MRSAIIAAPLVAGALAATSTGTTTVSYLSGTETVLSTYTYTYSNPATAYLTETNSAGVITGLPTLSGGETGIPPVVTSQPAPASIPAGLPTGQTVITYQGASGVTSFTINVEASTTLRLGGTKAGTTSGSVFIPAGQGTRTGNNGGTNTNTGTATGSAAASSSTGAAANVKVASAGIFGLGALFAALL